MTEQILPLAQRRFRGNDDAAVPKALVAMRGRPATIRCDHGARFTSVAVDAWA